MTAYNQLEPGLRTLSLSAVVGTNAMAGTEFAIPERGPRTFAWQTIFGTNNPTAVDIALQGSLDGTTWFSLDASTTVGGEAKTVVDRVVRFVRAYITTITNHGSGTLTTVAIVVS